MINKDIMVQAKENLKTFQKKLKSAKMPNKENIDTNKENINHLNKVQVPVYEKPIPAEKEPHLKGEISLEKDPQNDGDLDKVIANLRIAYQEIKKERVKTEKDTDYLEHKLKLLLTEEMNAYKKFQNEKKFKEEWELARNKTQEFRKFINEAKSKKKHESEEMSKKIKEMREYIQRSTNVKKMMKFQENRLSSLQMKQKKIENGELRRSMMEEKCQKNKRMAESVKLREKNYLEKKKLDGEEKKKKLKKELEVKLMTEQFMKKLFKERLNTLEEQESGLLKKIKTSEEISKSDRKYRSLSTGSSSKKVPYVKSVLKKM